MDQIGCSLICTRPVGEDGFVFAMKTCFKAFFLNPCVFGLNRVLDTGIYRELGVTIVVGMGRFRRALSAGWFNRYL